MNPRHYQKLEECPGRDSNPMQGEKNSKQDAPLLCTALYC